MTDALLAVTLPSPDATARLAERLASRLRPGDCLLLHGPIGAGKTHFARALIQSLLDTPEDVPSPTYTLVQTYASRAGEIWHCDLYRIGSVSEIEELGLPDALTQAICLIEWPDRLGDLIPRDALDITLAPDARDGDTRHITLAARGPTWAARLDGLADD